MIEVANISVEIAGTTVLDGADAWCENGEILGICGGNGSGKTSLLRVMAGELIPIAGQIIIDNKTVKLAEGVQSRRNSGVYFLPQGMPLFQSLKVSTLCRALSQPVPKWIRSSERWTASLSGGEQRRLAVDLISVDNCTVALLDEPLAGLDGGNRSVLSRYISSLARKYNIAVIVTGHSPVVYGELTDRLIWIESGNTEPSG